MRLSIILSIILIIIYIKKCGELKVADFKAPVTKTVWYWQTFKQMEYNRNPRNKLSYTWRILHIPLTRVPKQFNREKTVFSLKVPLKQISLHKKIKNEVGPFYTIYKYELRTGQRPMCKFCLF